MGHRIPTDAYAIIVGAMKCGTTSLYDLLAKHRAVCECRVKEPEFFSTKQLHGLLPKPRTYEELWNFDPRRHRVALEASSGYSKYPYEPDVAERIRAYGINPKLIYIVRNPFDRIESHYNFIKNSTGYWVPRSLSDKGMVELSMYHTQLERFRTQFGRERILVVQFDALRSGEHGVLENLCRFLDLDPRQLPRQLPRLNDSALQSTWERWLHRHGLHRLLTALPEMAQQRVRRTMRTLSAAEPRRFTADERAEVYRLLSPDMRLLERNYGVDVGAWGFAAAEPGQRTDGS